MSDNIYNPSNRSTLITSGNGSVPNLQQSDLSRILPRQLSTGSTRGVQKVGYGNVNIDGSNNRITIGDTDGSSIGMGSIPNTNEVGFFSLDSSGTLVWKQVGPTSYVYNPKDSYHNVEQNGILPDGSGGWAIAAPGYDVAQGFTS